MELLKKIFSATVGAVVMTEEKVRETVDEWVKRGEMSEQEGSGAVQEILDRVEENKKFIQDKIEEQFESVLKKTKIATEQDLQDLEKRVEKLESLLAAKKKESK